MKTEIENEVAKLRGWDDTPRSDYELLRKNEILCAKGLGGIIAMTILMAHTVDKLIGEPSLWNLAPYPIGLALYFGLYRRMKRLRAYCQLFEVRIGNNPIGEGDDVEAKKNP
jgi:hypothetical protein